MTCIVFMLVMTGCDRGTSGLKGQTNASLTFYGMAVDEGGRPLAGVQFDFVLEAYPRDWTFGTRGRPNDRTTLKVTSGADGRFQLDVDGCMLGITRVHKPGYRQLEELDGSDGNRSCFTKSIGLISWGDQQYKSDPDNPAVYVLVAYGTKQVAALPCAGGYRSYGRHWIANRPRWPAKPSLPDVDWQLGQPRVNVDVPFIVKVVDVDGVPQPNVNVCFAVEQYRSLDEMRRDSEYSSTVRTKKAEVTARSGADGLARLQFHGFRVLSLRRGWVDGTRWGEGPGPIDEASNDYYAREFMNPLGEPIFRCGESNPAIVVMRDRDVNECHVLPSRGGYELRDGKWEPVEPRWPENPRGRINLRLGAAATTQPQS